jgi:hypothetical protein
MIVSHQPHYAGHVIDRREVIDQALEGRAMDEHGCLTERHGASPV